MDLDWAASNTDQNNEKEDNGKKSLSARDRNEITASMIKKQIGDIEQVRALMGLNKRKMCELLLIDPSTWTRWTTGKTNPPTWVYRTLQWGLAVMDKHPEFHPLIKNQGVSELNRSNPKELKKLVNEIDDIKKDLQKWTRIAFGSFSLSLLLFAYILTY